MNGLVGREKSPVGFRQQHLITHGRHAYDKEISLRFQPVAVEQVTHKVVSVCTEVNVWLHGGTT